MKQVIDYRDESGNPVEIVLYTWKEARDTVNDLIARGFEPFWQSCN